MMKLRAILQEYTGKLPLSWVAGAYNLRRSLDMLIPVNHYPLSDPSDALCCQPLIFVSAGRSGTTLLRSMLVMGGQIAIPPESFAIAFAALQYQAMQEQSWYNLVRLVISLFEGVDAFRLWDINLNPVYVQARSLPKEQRSLAKVIELIFMHYAKVHFPDAITWGDQSPQNSQRLHWIREVFPNAKYLHILRDGRDVVASYIKKGDDFEWAINRWTVAIKAADELKQRIPSQNFLEVRYKDLVTNSTSLLQSVCAFSGIKYDESMLNYWQSSTTIEHRYRAHHQNLKKPIFASSIGSWQERLLPEQQSIANEKMGQLLTKLGYT